MQKTEKQNEREIIERIKDVIRTVEAREPEESENRRIHAAKLDSWMNAAILELIKGYERRQSLLLDESVKPWVRREYQRINRCIDQGINDACAGYEPSVADSIKTDLCRGQGFRFSMLSTMFSERAYYHTKRLCVVYIAWRMGFL